MTTRMISGLRSNAPHFAIGACFVLLGGALILDRLGVLEAGRVLDFWPLGLVLLGLSLIVQAASPRDAGTPRPGFPLGAFLLLAVVTASVGRASDSRPASVEPRADRTVRLSSVLGGRHESVAGTFRAADITAVMGGSELDLRKATIPPGEEAVIDLFTLMGGAVIRAPRHWVFDVESTVVMGGVHDQRNAPEPPRRQRRNEAGASWGDEGAGTATPVPPEPESAATVEPDGGPPPRIVVRGFVMMGGLAIKP